MFKKNFDHELRRIFATLVDKQAHEELGCFMNLVVLFEGLLPGKPKQNILRAKRSGTPIISVKGTQKRLIERTKIEFPNEAHL